MTPATLQMTEADPHSLPPVVHVPPAAAVLGIGPTAVYEPIRCGKWPTLVLRLGRLIRVPSAPMLATPKVGRPVISLRADDCQRNAERLKAKGVGFVREPARMDYEGMDAVFDDTCGNLINVHED